MVNGIDSRMSGAKRPRLTKKSMIKGLPFSLLIGSRARDSATSPRLRDSPVQFTRGLGAEEGEGRGRTHECSIIDCASKKIVRRKLTDERRGCNIFSRRTRRASVKNRGRDGRGRRGGRRGWKGRAAEERTRFFDKVIGECLN